MPVQPVPERRAHKNSQIACGQRAILPEQQQLGCCSTRLVMFHKLGQVVAQKGSVFRTKMICLLITKIVMFITILVMMGPNLHNNSHFSRDKLLIFKDFLTSECWLAFNVY